jgi:hypothetical protein
MIEMTHLDTSSETRNSRWGWLNKIGGVSALIIGTLLLIGMISLIFSVFQPITTNSWLSLFENIWLVKIFVLHAEFSNMDADLHGRNLLDIFILLLVSVICLSISTNFRKARKVWSLSAFALSVIAILLFLVTQIAGRSTVMLVVLIISFVMLRDKTFGKVAVYTGILASVFLFVGDLTVGVHSIIITALFSVGYVLLIIWFFLIAQSLFRLGHIV